MSSLGIHSEIFMFTYSLLTDAQKVLYIRCRRFQHQNVFEVLEIQPAFGIALIDILTDNSPGSLQPEC